MDETLSLIGDEALNRCLDLRISLSKRSARFVTDISSTASDILSPRSHRDNAKPEARTSMSHDFQNIPSSVSPFSITPWKSSTIPSSLPNLPKILDPTLEASAFVHILCTKQRPGDLSYERLEFVGDAYLEITATLLISQTFPSLLPGKCSQLREKIVKNVTLALYARSYGFDKRARLPSDHSFKPDEMTKVLGDIFEAYVAAVVLSDPVDGVRRASEWLKDLWGQTLMADIIHEEKSSFKLDSPLWRLRGQVGSPDKIEINDPSQPIYRNAKEELQIKLGGKNVKLRYEDMGDPKKALDSKLTLYNVGVFLDGWGVKDKLLGTGKGHGKKDAGYRAAENALQNKKLLKGYEDKKKILDAQRALEKEALAKLENEA